MIHRWAAKGALIMVSAEALPRGVGERPASLSVFFHVGFCALAALLARAYLGNSLVE